MCIDPATAAIAASAISAAATAGQGIAGYMQGKATEKAYKQQARVELQNAAIEETQMRKEGARFMARQRLQLLASGADISTGTADVLASSDASRLELSALMRRYEGETEAEALRHEGRSAARSGAVNMGFSFLQAGAQALGSQQQWSGLQGTGAPAVRSKRPAGGMKVA